MNTYNYLDYFPKGRDEDSLRFTIVVAPPSTIAMRAAGLQMQISPTGRQTLFAGPQIGARYESQSNGRASQ